MNHILLLTDGMPQGGAERQLVYLASGLKEGGNAVRLVTFYPVANFYEDDLINKGINIECYPKGRNGIKRAFIIRNLVKKWKPQMVISYKPGTCMAACLARMITKFNLVVSERNTTQKLSKKERIKFYLYQFADHIVPNSFSQAKYIQANFPELYSKVTIITNMLDIDKFYKKENQKNTYLQILTVARISPQKNIINYLDAIKIIIDKGIRVHFNWYGRLDDNTGYWNKIEKKIEELNIANYVTFHNPTNDLLRVYNSHDIFLLPSQYEGFPNVLCEAMACEMPCLASKVGDNPFILKDFEWLINPNDSENIASTVIKMINLTPSVRKEIGKKNRDHIWNQCSEESFIKKYISLINNQ